MTKVIIESTSIAGSFREIDGMDKDFYSKIVKSLHTEPYILIGFVFFMVGDERDTFQIVGLVLMVLGYYRLKNRLRESSFADNSPQDGTNNLS